MLSGIVLCRVAHRSINVAVAALRAEADELKVVGIFGLSPSVALVLS